ncbi:MAG: NAD(P)H-binding protein [Leptospirales bacterium]|nr:NAD(P)H-binding protein [Leptospirales bacterium]
MKVFVYGARSLTGGGIVEELLASGHQVVAGARQPESLPVRKNLSYVRVDASQPQLGLEALDGVEALTLLSPPGFTTQFEILSPWISRAQERGLKRVVLMTAMGVEFAPPEAPMRKSELFLESSGLDHTIIRPNWFMQNFNTFWVEGIRKDRKIYFPGGEARTSFIDARDISAVAAKLVAGREFLQQAINLTGPQALSHAEVAAQISAAIDQKVEYVDISSQQFQDSLAAAGLPPDYVGFMVYIAGALKEGHAAPITDNVQKVLGRPPRDFAGYARDSKKAWL